MHSAPSETLQLFLKPQAYRVQFRTYMLSPLSSRDVFDLFLGRVALLAAIIQCN